MAGTVRTPAKATMQGVIKRTGGTDWSTGPLDTDDEQKRRMDAADWQKSSRESENRAMKQAPASIGRTMENIDDSLSKNEVVGGAYRATKRFIHKNNPIDFAQGAINEATDEAGVTQRTNNEKYWNAYKTHGEDSGNTRNYGVSLGLKPESMRSIEDKVNGVEKQGGSQHAMKVYDNMRKLTDPKGNPIYKDDGEIEAVLEKMGEAVVKPDSTFKRGKSTAQEKKEQSFRDNDYIEANRGNQDPTIQANVTKLKDKQAHDYMEGVYNRDLNKKVRTATIVDKTGGNADLVSNKDRRFLKKLGASEQLDDRLDDQTPAQVEETILSKAPKTKSDLGAPSPEDRMPKLLLEKKPRTGGTRSRRKIQDMETYKKTAPSDLRDYIAKFNNRP